MDILIKQELTEEYNETEKVVKSAFLNEEYSDKKEHLLVKRIRKSDEFIPELSLVALNPNEVDIIGHILLSKITIIDGDNATVSLALAPSCTSVSKTRSWEPTNTRCVKTRKRAWLSFSNCFRAQRLLS